MEENKEIQTKEDIPENTPKEEIKTKNTAARKNFPKGALIASIVTMSTFIIALCVALVVISGSSSDSRKSGESAVKDYSYYGYDAYDEYAYAAVEEEAEWYNGGDMAYAPALETDANDAYSKPAGQTNGTKIIQSASLSLQTKEFEKATSGIEALVTSFGGYMQYQNINNKAGSGYRSARYTARIPSNRLDEFLNSAPDTCTISSLTRNAEDVSDEYYDKDSRLKTAKIKLERLQTLLEKAELMEDIILLESEISDVEWEIDSLSGSLRQIDSLVDYSTVEISLNEVYEVITETPPPKTFGDKIKDAFKASIKGLKEFAGGLILFFVEAWPFFVILGIIIVVIIALVKHHKKKKKE